MSRRRDAATATVGAGLTATGGYLRHVGAEEFIHETKEHPRFHGPAIAMRGTPLARKLYGAGAVTGLVGAPALAIGGSKLVRRKPKDPVLKRDPNKPSFLKEGLQGTGEALIERKDTAMQRNVPFKARAAGAGTSVGAGTLGALAARGLLRHKGGGTKALITPVAGVLTGAAATPLSSRVVHHVSPGYEVTASGVKRKKRTLKRASSASYQHRNLPRSFQSDISKIALRREYHGTSQEGYEAIEREGFKEQNAKFNDHRGKAVYTTPHKDVANNYRYSHHEPLKPKGPRLAVYVAGPGKKWAGKEDHARQGGVARRASQVIDWDVDDEAHKPAPVSVPKPRKGGRGKFMLAGAGVAGVSALAASRHSKVKKDASSRKYRAKVMAAGAVPVPGVNWVAQTKTAGALAPTSKKRRAEATQFAGSATGDVAGFLGGAHGAAYLAQRSDRFQAGAEKMNARLESARARLPKLPKPKINMPAGASSGRAGKVVRAAVRPLKNPKTAAAAAVGGFGGQMVLGNALQQAAMTRNIHQGRVKKVASAPGMTRREQEKQLKRKSRLIAINTMGATTGAAGLATYGASKHPGLIAHKPQLEGLTLGLGALGGGIGSYGGFKRAKVERRDVRAQRKALGVAKGMPDPSALHVPTGLLKTKSYAVSSFRRKPSTGQMVRVKAGLR